MKAKGRRVASGITTDFSRAEKIADVRGTIKGIQFLINYYKLLADSAPENHLSYAVYKAILDKRKEILDSDYADLERDYQHSTNGEIPKLRQRNVELEQKLKILRSQLSPELQAAKRKKKVVRMKVKAEGLMNKIAQLEQELRDENFDFESDIGQEDLC